MASKRLIRFAREHRADPTKAEAVLWYALRGREFGVRFRRQDPIGPFIADFSCRQLRMNIEVDGVTHDDPERDRRRDEWFRKRGWIVLRFSDEEVLEHLDETLMEIWSVVQHRKRAFGSNRPPFRS